MVRTYVSEENGVVVAKITGCEFDAIRKIMKRYPWVDEFMKSYLSVGSYCFLTGHYEDLADYLNEYDDFDMDIRDLDEALNIMKLDVALMPSSYTRKSTARHGDKFNEETGKKLAIENVAKAHADGLERAMGRWYKKFFVVVA